MFSRWLIRFVASFSFRTGKQQSCSQCVPTADACRGRDSGRAALTSTALITIFHEEEEGEHFANFQFQGNNSFDWMKILWFESLILLIFSKTSYFSIYFDLNQYSSNSRRKEETDLRNRNQKRLKEIKISYFIWLIDHMYCDRQRQSCST